MTSATPVIRRLTHADDLAAFGRIVLESYLALPDQPEEREYEAALVNVGERVDQAVVFGAFVDGRPVGCVTYVADHTSPYAEGLAGDEVSFRMLGVDPQVQGMGVGELLVRRCLDEAAADGARAVSILSGDWMAAAHRLYGRLGFAREPARDRTVGDPPIRLLAFTRAV
jgi:GNAT superfamily N-acetyltransferase